MQSGVIRGHIRNEFITHHSTLSNHRPERILAHPARFLLGLPQISQIYTDNSSLQATVLTKPHRKTPKESKICENLCNLWEN